jgi:F-type H+-transporting ATPase subunit b
MSLPHFEVSSFASQGFWLLITGGLTYLLNKFFFIPAISTAVLKRKKIISDYIAETQKINQHIDVIQADLQLLSKKCSDETKIIIENALLKSNSLFLKHTQKNHKELSAKMQEYDDYIKNQRQNLMSNIEIIVSDIKDKITHFILR